MKRRLFVKSSFLATSISAVTQLAAAETTGKKTAQEYYEWREYTLKNEEQEKALLNYFETAAVPAFNRLGSKNIGVFMPYKQDAQRKLYVLIPYTSMNDFVVREDKLAADAMYKKAAAGYLNAPAATPAYERIENSFFKALSGLPRIAVPQNKPRLFEFRRYESASETAGKKKIEMFNEGGEIEIFKKTGLKPVFFGEALIGTMRPNLSYMIVFDDMDEHDRNWKTFGGDPEWKRISSLPEYANNKIVSRITATFLIPAPFSQV